MDTYKEIFHSMQIDAKRVDGDVTVGSPDYYLFTKGAANVKVTFLDDGHGVEQLRTNSRGEKFWIAFADYGKGTSLQEAVAYALAILGT